MIISAISYDHNYQVLQVVHEILFSQISQMRIVQKTTISCVFSFFRLFLPYLLYLLTIFDLMISYALTHFSFFQSQNDLFCYQKLLQMQNSHVMEAASLLIYHLFYVEWFQHELCLVTLIVIDGFEYPQKDCSAISLKLVREACRHRSQRLALIAITKAVILNPMKFQKQLMRYHLQINQEQSKYYLFQMKLRQ